MLGKLLTVGDEKLLTAQNISSGMAEHFLTVRPVKIAHSGAYSWVRTAYSSASGMAQELAKYS